MKTHKNYRIGILILSLICCSLTINAAHHNIGRQNTHLSPTFIKQKNESLKKTIKSFFSEKKAKDDDKIIKRASKLSFIFGFVTVGSLLLGGFINLFLILAFVFGTIGVICAIGAISRIGKADNPKEYATEKRKAKIGLWLNLGTILFPFVLFIIWLLSLIISG